MIICSFMIETLFENVKSDISSKERKNLLKKEKIYIGKKGKRKVKDQSISIWCPS